MAEDAKRSFVNAAFTTYVSSRCFTQKSIHDIFQDQRRFLWFATQDGVVRFDGTDWVKRSVRDGLSHPHVRRIAQRADGMLLFATAGGGVACFDQTMRQGHGGWTRIAKEHGLASDDIGALLVEPELEWFGTSGGLCLRKAGAFRTLTVDDGLPANEVLALRRDKSGVLWVGTSGGVVCLDEQLKPAKTFGLKEGLAHLRVTCLCEDSGGRMWLGTAGGGVSRVDERGALKTFGPADGLANKQITCAHADAEGDVWFGTWGSGAAVAKQRAFGGRVVFSTIDSKDGLGNNNVRCIYTDNVGRTWLGTGGAGATCITPAGRGRAKAFRSLTERDGLARNMVASIAQDTRGRMWFGTFAGGVSCFDPNAVGIAWRNYTTRDGLAHDTVRATIVDTNGNLWFGTTGGGVNCFNPTSGQWRTFSTSQGLGSDIVRCVLQTSDGKIWIGTDGGGLCCISSESLTVLANYRADEAGLVSDHVYALLEAGDTLWIGTHGGGLQSLHRPSNTWTRYPGLRSSYVMCLARDPSGRIWCGTNGGGLAVLGGDDFEHYDRSHGLPHDVIYALLFDPNGVLYGSSISGVFRLTFHEGAPTIVVFDTTDGLADDECNAAAGLKDRSGRLWFGTIGGASYLVPSEVPQSEPACPVYLTGFLADGQPQPLAGEVAVAPGRYEYVFSFAAPDMETSAKLQYKCKLEPLERDWLPLSDARSLRYTNLPPGAYVFQVATKNWSGQLSEPATLAFTVLAANGAV